MFEGNFGLFGDAPKQDRIDITDHEAKSVGEGWATKELSMDEDNAIPTTKQEKTDITAYEGEGWISKPMGEGWATKDLSVDDAIPATKQERADITVHQGERWISKPVGEMWATKELSVDEDDAIPATK